MWAKSNFSLYDSHSPYYVYGSFTIRSDKIPFSTTSERFSVPIYLIEIESAETLYQIFDEIFPDLNYLEVWLKKNHSVKNSRPLQH